MLLLLSSGSERFGATPLAKSLRSFGQLQFYTTEFEKQIKKLETDPFCSEEMTHDGSSNRLAFMIDLDLQFVLVPTQWINTIIQQKMVRVLDVL